MYVTADSFVFILGNFSHAHKYKTTVSAAILALH